jgi:hypothetical protein
LQQGQQALERSNAARGGATGGGAAKALMDYGQGAAKQEYQAAFNRFDTTRQTTAGMLNNLAGRGLSASGQAGQNDINAATYAGNTGIGAATYGGNAGINAAQFGAGLQSDAAARQGTNTMNAGQYTGNSQIHSGEAIANGDIGAGKAWTGMLSSIGSGLDSAVSGGFGGGGGFNLGGALSGIPNYASGGFSGNGGFSAAPAQWSDPFAGTSIPGVSDYRVPMPGTRG